MPYTKRLEAAVLRRLRAGERAKRIAVTLATRGVTLRQVYQTASRHDITLKRGAPVTCPNPRAFARHFDARHGPGVAAAWRQLRSRLTLEELGAKFGYRTRARAHEIDKRLSPGKPKPLVWRRWRPPVVAYLRRIARRYPSRRALAQRLGVSEYLLNGWGRHCHVALPDGRRIKKAKGVALRRSIRKLARRVGSVTAIARIIHRHRSVVYFWNQHYHLGLRRRPYRRRSQLSAA